MIDYNIRRFRFKGAVKFDHHLFNINLIILHIEANMTDYKSARSTAFESIIKILDEIIMI